MPFILPDFPVVRALAKYTHRSLARRAFGKHAQ